MRALLMHLVLTAVSVGLAKPATADVVIQAEKAAIRTEGGPAQGGGWNLWSNGHVGQAIRVATAGKYGVVVRAWGSPAGGVWPEMALLVDGQAARTVTVSQAERKDYRFEATLTAGVHEIAAAFLNDALIEFEPAASGQKITGSHRQGVWDEAAQADYAVKFYRVCFAHPAVRAITWWDLGDQGSFLPGGGMLRRDLSPKPVYEQLKRLIHEEWRTKVSDTTDAEGRFAFRGFFGQYRLVIQTPAGNVQRALRLVRDGPSEIEVRLPKMPANTK